MDVNEFLCNCDNNPEYCGKYDIKSRKCSDVDQSCPVRLIKVDGKYVCNTMQQPEEKLLNMLLTIIPNNTGFGLYNVSKNEDSITYEFGSIYTKKRIKIMVE